MTFMLILSLLLTLAPWEDLRKALEFQYESELRVLRENLGRTQNALAEKEKELRSCQANQHEARKTPPSKDGQSSKRGSKSKMRSDKKSVEARKAAYQEALELMTDERWNEALIAFEAFAQSYPESALADNAVFLMSEVYLHRGENLLAKSELQRLLQQYPKSDRRSDALLRLQRIEDGQKLQSEAK
jgi:TolA-binding protein